jgi:hypothetical protein
LQGEEVMIICFKEKYGDRYVEGDSAEQICAHILKKRIEDTCPDGTSIWYGDDTPSAKAALLKGDARRYLALRRDAEYEGYEIITPEKAE